MRLEFKFLPLLTFFAFFQNALLAQPANDNCAGAIALTPGLGCTPTTGTTTGATASPQPTDCFGSADDDVWYKFVATSSKHLVSLTGTTLTDPVLVVYNGTCNTLGTPVACLDQGGFYTETAYLPNLTVGNTYLVRLYTWSSFGTGEFEICVTDASIPPANDECAGAVDLTPAAGLTCSSTVTGTTLGATQSMPACASFTTSDDDVWYQFVATNTHHQLDMDEVSSFGDFTSYTYELFSGSCGTLTSLSCYDGYGIFDMNNLTVGNTYYVRIYTSDAQGAISFSLCLRTVPPPPANNDCANAISLTTSTSINCATSTNGTTAGATESPNNTNCFGDIDDDVWYQFVATNDRHIVTLLGISGAGANDPYDMALEVLTGSCGNLTSVACGQYEVLVNNLQVGQTYYIRVYEYGTGNFANFNICVSTPPPPPANDDCANAVSLTPAINCGAPVTGNTSGATESSVGGSFCFGTDDDDVWYKFVATETTHEVTVSPNTIDDIVFEVFSGTCTNFTSLACVDNTGGSNEETTLQGLTVGNTYFVRVFSYGGSFGSTGSFDICVSVPAPPPANDLCGGAIVLTPNNGVCNNPVTGTTAGATGGDSNCFFGVDDEVWYQFTATSNNNTITVTPGTIEDIIFEVSTGATCNNLTNVACVDNGFSSEEVYTSTNFVVGNTYFVRVASYSSGTGAGTFTICVTQPGPPPANDECANVQLLTPSLTCNNPLLQTSISGTASNNPNNCSGEADDDLWYGFYATQTSHTILVQGQSNFDAVVEVTQGCQGTLLSCADFSLSGGLESVNLNGLVLGQLYHIRVYNYYQGGGNFTICVQGQPSSVINIDAAQAGVEVFPNPAKGSVNIRLPETESASSIALINAQGQQCVTLEGTALSGTQQLNTAALPAGLYMVQIYSNNRYLFSKLVVE